jgi:hypothetical protein
MSIVVKLYGLTARDVIKQTGAAVDLLGANPTKISLHTLTYAPNRDTDDFFNDATNEIAGGNGYAQQTLAGKTIVYDSASNQVRFDCNDIVFSFTGANTWLYGVVWIDTAGASTTDPLYALLTWDTSQTVSTTYTLVIDPAGLLYWDTT